MPYRNCPLKEAASSLPAFGLYSFSDLDKIADQLASTLQAKGIGPGDRIAILHPPCAEYAALFFAAWRIGASLCPLSSRLPRSQIEAQIARLDAKLFVDSFPMRNPTRSSTYFLPYPATLLFTSGSTGTPKIAVLSLSNLLFSASPAVKTLSLFPKDRWLLNLPLYHVGGIGILLRCILARACCTLDPSDPAITHISAVSTQLYRATPIYKNLRCLLIGGAPISSYPERLPCYLTYGLTEMGSLVSAIFRPSQTCQVGTPLPEREMRISPEGEICVRGNCLFQGYWEEGKIHRPLDAEGWFATGDLGSCGPEGFSILGRKDWQFISGGENIQPEEIEQELRSLPNILEAAVIPIPDPEFGHRPAAFIASSDPNTVVSRIQSSLAEKLPKFKIPNSIFLLAELPKNGLKIDRGALFEFANKKFN